MKVGLFFGSFNPYHLGHKIVASYMAEFTDLEQVWIIVSKQNPFKKEDNLLDAHHRLMIIRMEEEDNTKISPSSIEFGLPQPSYTINTLNILREKNPENEFVIIKWADNLQEYDKWKDNKKILQKHLLYIYPRPGISITMEHKNIKVFQDVPQIEISASFIREAIKRNKNISFLIPNKAFNYIDQMNFYRN